MIATADPELVMRLYDRLPEQWKRLPAYFKEPELESFLNRGRRRTEKCPYMYTDEFERSDPYGELTIWLLCLISSMLCKCMDELGVSRMADVPLLTLDRDGHVRMTERTGTCLWEGSSGEFTDSFGMVYGEDGLTFQRSEYVTGFSAMLQYLESSRFFFIHKMELNGMEYTVHLEPDAVGERDSEVYDVMKPVSQQELEEIFHRLSIRIPDEILRDGEFSEDMRQKIFYSCYGLYDELDEDEANGIVVEFSDLLILSSPMLGAYMYFAMEHPEEIGMRFQKEHEVLMFCTSCLTNLIYRQPDYTLDKSYMKKDGFFHFFAVSQRNEAVYGAAEVNTYSMNCMALPALVMADSMLGKACDIFGLDRQEREHITVQDTSFSVK